MMKRYDRTGKKVLPAHVKIDANRCQTTCHVALDLPFYSYLHIPVDLHLDLR